MKENCCLYSTQSRTRLIHHLTCSWTAIINERLQLVHIELYIKADHIHAHKCYTKPLFLC
jgi:hypothetical protein